MTNVAIKSKMPCLSITSSNLASWMILDLSSLLNKSENKIKMVNISGLNIKLFTFFE